MIIISFFSPKLPSFAPCLRALMDANPPSENILLYCFHSVLNSRGSVWRDVMIIALVPWRPITVPRGMMVVSRTTVCDVDQVSTLGF